MKKVLVGLGLVLGLVAYHECSTSIYRFDSMRSLATTDLTTVQVPNVVEDFAMEVFEVTGGNKIMNEVDKVWSQL